jgi:SAM-dependent methyltransferase
MWGSERGTSVDRHHIDRFFATRSAFIRGRVLEVRDTRYSARFGHDIERVDIVDIDGRNDNATLIVDLADPGCLEPNRYDCAIVAQTLMYVTDPFVAVGNLWRSIAPGGVLLVTVAAIARVAPDAPDVDRWHMTAAGLTEVLQRSCPGGDIEVEAHGNPITAIAFLQGITQEELRAEELDAEHPLFPIVVTGVARKTAT